MCGRYVLQTPAEELAEFFGVSLSPSLELSPRYNIAPSQPVPVITNADPKHLQLYRWGLVPYWAEDIKVGYSLINARADTLASKPAFKEALKRRRCLVLADGFYEWRVGPDSKRKTPFFIHMKDGHPFAFAGLWESWHPPGGGDVLHSCTIVTTGPNEICAPLHDRMPAILPRDAHAHWLGRGELSAEELEHVLAPFPAIEMEAYPVATTVNSPDNEGPALLQRAP